MGQAPRTLPGWLWFSAILALAFVPAALRAAVPRDSARSSGKLAFSARYALGAARIAGSAFAGFMEGLDAAANSAVDRLRLIPVVAELQGAHAALARLALAREETGLSPDDARDLDILERLYRDGTVPATDLALLIERHGWFGELAAVYGWPDTEPARQRMLDGAMRSAISTLIALGGVILAAVVGMVLLFLAFALRVRFAFAGQTGQSRLDETLWIETAAVAIGLAVAAAVPIPVVNVAVTLLIPGFVLVWPLLRGSSWQELRRAIGLHRGRGFWREVAAGIAGYVAAMPVFLLGLLATLWIAYHFESRAEHPIVEQIVKGGLPRLLLVYMTACVWAPVVEESLFRGLLYRFLRRYASTAVAAPVVGLLFAALHPQGFAAIPALAALGAMLCVIREWRASLIAPIFAHAVHNFAVVTLVLLVLG